MTERKYKNYSMQDLLEDQEFVSIVRKIKTDEEWKEFLLSHGEAASKLSKARKFILLFKANEGKLSLEKKHLLWKNINAFDQIFGRNYRFARIKFVSKIAASVLVVLLTGVLVFLYTSQRESRYHFSEIQTEVGSEVPLLILSNGEKVDLIKKESEIAILEDKAIRINNDSVINNEPINVDKGEDLALNEVIIPYGKKSKLVLSDGTLVWLNAGSRFAFPQKFNGKKREVFLQGEAYFEVAKNEDHPFVVSTGNVNVEVLGTKFNVCAYKSDGFMETVLVEGSVKMIGKGSLIKDKVLLAPKQKALFNNEEGTISVTDEPMPELYTAWIDGWYQFENEDIGLVFNKLKRYYNVSFVCDEAVLGKALPISGKLDLKGSLDEVMRVLSKVAKVNYRMEGECVFIKQ
jgi:hypothetical protein